MRGHEVAAGTDEELIEEVGMIAERKEKQTKSSDVPIDQGISWTSLIHYSQPNIRDMERK